jgi:hypothetical protein
MNQYKRKYLKYKLKYNNLNKKLKGGTNQQDNIITIKYIFNNNKEPINKQVKINDTLEYNYLFNYIYDDIYQNYINVKEFKIISDGKVFYNSSTNSRDEIDYETLNLKKNIFVVIQIEELKEEQIEELKEEQIEELKEEQIEELKEEQNETIDNTKLCRRFSDMCTVYHNDDNLNNVIYTKYHYPMLSNLDTVIPSDKDFLEDFFNYIKIFDKNRTKYNNPNLQDSRQQDLIRLVIKIDINNIEDIKFNFRFFTSTFDQLTNTPGFDTLLNLYLPDNFDKIYFYTYFNEYLINLLIDNQVLEALLTIVKEDYNIKKTKFSYIFILDTDYVIARSWKINAFHKDPGLFFTLIYDKPGISAEVFKSPHYKVTSQELLPPSMRINLTNNIIENITHNQLDNKIIHFNINQFSRLTIANYFYYHSTPTLKKRDKQILINQQIRSYIDDLLLKIPENLYLSTHLLNTNNYRPIDNNLDNIEVIFIENNKTFLLLDDETYYINKHNDNNIWIEVRNIIDKNIDEIIDCSQLYFDLIKPISDKLFNKIIPNLPLNNEFIWINSTNPLIIESYEKYRNHSLFKLIIYIYQFFIKICSYTNLPVTNKLSRTLSNYDETQLNLIKNESIERNFLRLHLKLYKELSEKQDYNINQLSNEVYDYIYIPFPKYENLELSQLNTIIESRKQFVSQYINVKEQNI